MSLFLRTLSVDLPPVVLINVASLRGRWSCFFVTPFIIRVKKPKQKGKEREQGTNNALKRPSFQSYHRPTLAHHSRFSLQSVASVESCCRTLAAQWCFLEGPRRCIFLCTDGFRKIRIPSHHTCLRYLKDAFLFHYSTFPHYSTVPLTSA